MKQIINDLIHMTEGDLLINYWWFWILAVIVIVTIMILYGMVKTKRK
ncbi:hypothetical protein J6TS2_48490 [Heyndrickxia sporothermodurans]|nr:hypothetical protein J6TS2_48490 [Heyndrickxia sporothermodurans]